LGNFLNSGKSGIDFACFNIVVYYKYIDIETITAKLKIPLLSNLPLSGGVCLKIYEQNSLGSGVAEFPPNSPFRLPRLACPTDRQEPERKERFQVFLWRQIL
jgi:hypothetical protein